MRAPLPPRLALILMLSLSVAAHAAAPFAVGSRTVFVHDPSRPFDQVAGIDTGIRTLITEIWYPVAPKALPPDARRATYADYVLGDETLHRRMMTATTFFHLTQDTVRPGVTGEQIDAAIAALYRRQRGSYLDAPMAPGPCPVVLVSHGDAGSRYNMESACEALAASGYVVIAPEHTGNSPFTQVGRDPLLAQRDASPRYHEHAGLVARITDAHGTYGDPALHGQSYSPLGNRGDPAQALRQLDAALLERVNDLRAVLAWIDANQNAGDWQGQFDAAQVGLMGRSFGAATVLAALGLEPRFAAGFAVVAPAWPDPRPGLPEAQLIDHGESVLLSRRGGFPLLELSKPTLLLNAAEDALIIGLAAARAHPAGTAPPTAEQPHPTLHAAFRDSTQPAVWALLANANHDSPATSAHYWWPELKPDRYPRVFEPDTSYELMDPIAVHAIQQRLAVDFFAAFLAQDPAAAARLAHTDRAPPGLTLEARNF